MSNKLLFSKDINGIKLNFYHVKNKEIENPEESKYEDEDHYNFLLLISSEPKYIVREIKNDDDWSINFYLTEKKIDKYFDEPIFKIMITKDLFVGYNSS